MRRVPTLLVVASLCASAPEAAATHPPTRTRAPAAAAQGCADAAITVTAATATRAARSVLCLFNVQRTAAGLAPLSANPSLGQVAARYARAMVRSHFFAHVSPGGSTLLSRVARTSYLRGAGNWALGEDIAWGTAAYSTPQAIVAAWMASPPHRRNILEPSFRDAGIGVRRGVPSPGAGDGATYVADFGLRTP